MFNYLMSFAKILALQLFLFQIDITAPYPAASNDRQEFLLAEPDDHEIQTKNVMIRSTNATHRDAQYEVTNIRSLHLSLGHALERTARWERWVSGCKMRKVVEHCGNDLIVTYKCRKRSVTCIQYGGAAPRCVKIKSYFTACRKVFNTDCQCKT